MHVHFSKKGYSLVEALVAIAILMIAIVGPLTIAAKSIQTSLYARQQIEAYFLAQEGLSLVESIRNDYGLLHTDAAINDPTNPVDPWSWITKTTLNPYKYCNTTKNLEGCNIDARDSSPISNIVDCSTPANCILKFDAGTSPTATLRQPLYKYMNSGTASQFTRVIKITPLGSDEVKVVVTVSWNSNLLSSAPGNTEKVVLETSLFNIYK